jgi:NAD+ diphosphatase
MPLNAFTNTYAGNPLDRAGLHRNDAAWIAERLAAPDSEALVLWNGNPLSTPVEGGARLVLLPAAEAKTAAEGEETLLFLGLKPEGGALFALDLEGEANPLEGVLTGVSGVFEGLRALAPRLPPTDAAIAAQAKAVFEWRRRHRFCAACGQPSRVAEAGWKRVCPACKAEHFPRTDPVVIMLAVQVGPDGEDRCLLGRQANWPPGMISTLAGFMEPGETIEEACARELFEEAKLEAMSVRYHSSQPWPYPANLMIGLIAEVGPGEGEADQTEVEAIRWFTRPEAAALLRRELEGLFCPPPFAIAHQLLKAWVEGWA